MLNKQKTFQQNCYYGIDKHNKIVYTIITEGEEIQMKIKVNGISYKWNGKRLLTNILKGLTFLALTGFYSWLLCEMMLALINR